MLSKVGKRLDKVKYRKKCPYFQSSTSKLTLLVHVTELNAQILK